MEGTGQGGRFEGDGRPAGEEPIDLEGVDPVEEVLASESLQKRERRVIGA